jgi:hypothetical protein
MADNFRSIQVDIASRMVLFLSMVGSTHRNVCFDFKTSDMSTSRNLLRSGVLASISAIGSIGDDDVDVDLSPFKCSTLACSRLSSKGKGADAKNRLLLFLSIDFLYSTAAVGLKMNVDVVVADWTNRLTTILLG